MKFLTLAECSHWLDQHQFQVEHPDVSKSKEGFVYLTSESPIQTLSVPEDSWGRLLFSNDLRNVIGSREVLLWITSWALYDPEEMEIFNDFRRTYGETRRLIDVPAQLIDTRQDQDAWTLLQLLHLMFIFNWEGFVLGADRQCEIRLADEIVEVHTVPPDQSVSINKMTEKWDELPSQSVSY